MAHAHWYSILREYQDKEHNPEVKALTYPNGSARNYYLEGDLVLVNRQQLRFLEKQFPELRAAANEDPSALQSLLQITLVFLGVESKEYVTGWRINKLSPWGGSGAGEATMQFLIVLDDDTPVPLGYPQRHSLELLNEKWRLSLTARDLVKNVMPIINAAAFIAEMGVTFGTSTVIRVVAKKAARKAAKAMIKRGMRRLLRIVLKTMASVAVKGSTAAVKVFTVKIADKVESHKADERVRLFGRKAETSFDWKPAIKSAATSAASEFVSALIEAVRESIFDKMDEFWKALDYMPKTIEQKIKEYLLKRGG